MLFVQLQELTRCCDDHFALGLEKAFQTLVLPVRASLQGDQVVLRIIRIETKHVHNLPAELSKTEDKLLHLLAPVGRVAEYEQVVHAGFVTVD